MYEVFNWNAEPPKRFSLSIIGHEINIDDEPPSSSIRQVPSSTSAAAAAALLPTTIHNTSSNDSMLLAFTNDVNMHYCNSVNYNYNQLYNTTATTTAFQTNTRQYLNEFISHTPSSHKAIFCHGYEYGYDRFYLYRMKQYFVLSVLCLL